MGILMWILFGAIVGWLASIFMGTSDGLVLDIVLGIVGAIIGGWVLSFFGKSGVTGFNVYSFLVAILGAIILIGLVKAIR